VLRTCPSCTAPTPASAKFCPDCGTPLKQRHSSVGEHWTRTSFTIRRALLLIAGLGLISVILLMRPAEDRDASTSTTPPPDTSTTRPGQHVLPVLSVVCSDPGIAGFRCENLEKETDAVYQIAWEARNGEAVTIRFVFRQPVLVQEMRWTNLTDPVRFERNYRAKGLLVSAQGAPEQVPVELQDSTGLQVLPYRVPTETNWVEIAIVSAYQARVIEGEVFRELAISDIELWGGTPCEAKIADAVTKCRDATQYLWGSVDSADHLLPRLKSRLRTVFVTLTCHCPLDDDTVDDRWFAGSGDSADIRRFRTMSTASSLWGPGTAMAELGIGEP
jgi:Double zinc ribbon